jgi:hypothetical protein
MSSDLKRYVLLIVVFVAGFAAYFFLRPLVPTYWPYLFVSLVLLIGIAAVAVRKIK